MITGIAPLSPSRDHKVTADGSDPAARTPVLLRPLNSASQAEIERLARVLFKGGEDAGKAILFTGLDDSGSSSEWVPLHMAHSLASAGRSAHVLYLQSRTDGTTPTKNGDKPVVLSDRCKVEWITGKDQHADLTQRVAQHLVEARKSGAQAMVHSANLARFPEALSCAGLLDGAVLLVRSGQTRKAAIATVRQQLEAADINVLGGILMDQAQPIPEKFYRLL